MLLECHSLNPFDKMSQRASAESGPTVKKYGKIKSGKGEVQTLPAVIFVEIQIISFSRHDKEHLWIHYLTI
jgi:hypothetical protein